MGIIRLCFWMRPLNATSDSLSHQRHTHRHTTDQNQAGGVGVGGLRVLSWGLGCVLGFRLGFPWPGGVGVGRHHEPVLHAVTAVRVCAYEEEDTCMLYDPSCRYCCVCVCVCHQPILLCVWERERERDEPILQCVCVCVCVCVCAKGQVPKFSKVRALINLNTVVL